MALNRTDFENTAVMEVVNSHPLFVYVHGKPGRQIEAIHN